MTPTPADELMSRERAWRERSLRVAFGLVAAAVALGGLPVTIAIGATWAATAMALSFPVLALGASRAAHRWAFDLRALLLLSALLAITVAGAAQVGPNAGFALAQAALVTLAGLFAGTRAMCAALALAAGADAAVYAGGLLGFLPWPSAPQFDWSRPLVWARFLVPLVFLAPAIGFPVLVVAERYERFARRREATRARIAAELASRDRARQGQKEAEEDFARAQRGQVVGRVGAALAREFENALVVIRCSTDALADPGASAAGRAEAVEAILAPARRAAVLTRQLMALARPAPAEPGAIADVPRVIGDVLGLARRILPASVRLEQRVQPGLRAALDGATLHQVLLNLVLNARDALPRGGRIDVEAQAAGTEGDAVTLCVSDDGTGMAPEVRARAFEPFYSTRPLGSGLGLPSSLALVRQAGGDLTLRSAPGMGTAAVITLPAPRSAAAAAPGGSLPASARALIVEPDEQLRRVTAHALTARGFEVIEAGDAAAAVERLRRLRGELHLLCVDATEFTAGVLRVTEECASLFPAAVTLAVGAPVSGLGAPGARLAFQPKPFVATELAERAAALVLGGGQPA